MDDAPGRTAQELAARGAPMFRGARIAGLAAMIQFVGLAFAALFWWQAMPRGFPANHPRFLMNVLIPPGLVLLGGVAAYAGLRSRPGLLRGCQLFVLGMATSAGVTGMVLYPHSMLGMKLLVVV